MIHAVHVVLRLQAELAQQQIALALVQQLNQNLVHLHLVSIPETLAAELTKLDLMTEKFYVDH